MTELPYNELKNNTMKRKNELVIINERKSSCV